MRKPSRHGRTRGFALILSLALVVLMTFAVVAYFSRATTNRRIESASFGAAKADILARAAAQVVISDVRNEITAGSTVTQPSQQMPIFAPLDPQKMVPSRALLQSAMETSPDFTNLIKQSGNRFYPAAGGYNGTPLILSSTGHDTSVMSANKRNVSVTRWNVPVLNSGAGFSSNDQLPRWILIDRTGVAATQTWGSTFRDYTPGNEKAIIGRFAFNVYDVGGLLDVNVAGNPVFNTQLTDAKIQQLKSTEAGASLYNRSNSSAIVPDFTAARQTALVNTWRYKSTSTSSTNFFLDFMSSSPTFADSGFMRPTVRSSISNTIAFCRQDLLRLTEASTGYLTTLGLPYFTHFSRELNAPSWIPVTPTGSTIDYASQAEQTSSVNRDVLNVRVKAAFTRADGTAAVLGEPLIKYRFPLRRLDGIGSSGVNTGGFLVMVGGALVSPSATTLQRDFGLTWNVANSGWDYVGATGSTVQTSISTLDQVASANREPNFFEILKAFILSGSIGLGSGAGRTIVDAEPRYYQQPLSGDAQIIQIGANIIDQWDADKNPTFITFGTNDFAGVENIPYLNKLIYQPRWNTSTTFGSWLVPSFWMLPQNGAKVSGTNAQSSTVPLLRFVMTGGSASAVVESGALSVSSNTVTPATGTPPSPSLQLVLTADFYTTPNTPSNASTPNSGVAPDAPNAKLGIPFVFTTLGTITRANTTRTYPKLAGATFEMQAQVSGTSGWKTYQRWTVAIVNTGAVTSAYDTYAGVNWGLASNYDPEFATLDPRTMGFGVWETH